MVGLAVVVSLLIPAHTEAQEIPSKGENIAYLVTFASSAERKWGDDDHVQTFFFVIPETQKEAIYIRVFDPDTGGELDQENNKFNSRIKFSVYGGQGAHSEKDARNIDPVGNYKSGTLLASKSFGNESTYDGKWYTFGPFNPSEGEYSEAFKAHMFKVIAEGQTGDDGNLYKYFLSTNADMNRPVEGGNGFTYEYSFRLVSEPGAKAHLYPFIDDQVKAIKQYNFDFDNDGFIKIYSVAKNGHLAKGSADNGWAMSMHPIQSVEKGKSLDIQIVKPKAKPFDNDMVFYVVNEYDESIPFFAVPIGGPPKYDYSSIQVKKYYGGSKTR